MKEIELRKIGLPTITLGGIRLGVAGVNADNSELVYETADGYILATADDEVYVLNDNGTMYLSFSSRTSAMTFYSKYHNYKVISDADVRVQPLTSVTYNDDGSVKSLGGEDIPDLIINRGEAVIIYGEKGAKIQLSIVSEGSEYSDLYEGNFLKGVEEDTLESDVCTDGYGYVYTMGYSATAEHNAGFFIAAKGMYIKAHKAYFLPSSIYGEKN